MRLKLLEPAFLPMEGDAAESIAGWSYPVPYGLYNHAPGQRPAVRAALCDPDKGYSRIRCATHGLVGFCCFGASAQVTGGDYTEAKLDIGMGMRPDLTGQGLGAQLADAVLQFADRSQGKGPRRVTIATFNERAIRVWKKLGFQPRQQFGRPSDGRLFLVLTR